MKAPTSSSAEDASDQAAFQVIPAEGVDRRACRMLLPDRRGEIGWVTDVSKARMASAMRRMPTSAMPSCAWASGRK